MGSLSTSFSSVRRLLSVSESTVVDLEEGIERVARSSMVSVGAEQLAEFKPWLKLLLGGGLLTSDAVCVFDVVCTLFDVVCGRWFSMLIEVFMRYTSTCLGCRSDISAGLNVWLLDILSQNDEYVKAYLLPFLGRRLSSVESTFIDGGHGLDAQPQLQDIAIFMVVIFDGWMGSMVLRYRGLSINDECRLFDDSSSLNVIVKTNYGLDRICNYRGFVKLAVRVMLLTRLSALDIGEVFETQLFDEMTERSLNVSTGDVVWKGSLKIMRDALLLFSLFMYVDVVEPRDCDRSITILVQLMVRDVFLSTVIEGQGSYPDLEDVSEDVSDISEVLTVFNLFVEVAVLQWLMQMAPLGAQNTGLLPIVEAFNDEVSLCKGEFRNVYLLVDGKPVKVSGKFLTIASQTDLGIVPTPNILRYVFTFSPRFNICWNDDLIEGLSLSSSKKAQMHWMVFGFYVVVDFNYAICMLVLCKYTKDDRVLLFVKAGTPILWGSYDETVEFSFLVSFIKPFRGMEVVVLACQVVQVIPQSIAEDWVNEISKNVEGLLDFPYDVFNSKWLALLLANYCADYDLFGSCTHMRIEMTGLFMALENALEMI